MRHFTYLAVLVACLAGALWLEPVLHINVLRRWRRLALTVATIIIIFGGWDLAAIAAGHWSYDRSQLVDVVLPGGLPLEELIFFIVVPICSILGFEAVRAVRRLPAGDEPLDRLLRPDAEPAPIMGPAPIVGSAPNVGPASNVGPRSSGGGPP